MPADMVDLDKGEIRRKAQRFCRGNAHKKRSRKPCAVGHPYRRQVGEPNARLGERLLDDGIDRERMIAARDFGDDPSETPVNFYLRTDDETQYFPPVPDDRRGSLVAGTLDSEHEHIPGRFQF